MSYPPQDDDPFQAMVSLAGLLLLFLFCLAVLGIGALFGGFPLK